MNGWLPLSMIGAGGSLVVGFFGAIAKFRAARKWPCCMGVVLSSQVERYWSRIGGSHWLLYRPRVVYSYEVEGISYTTERIALAEINTSNEDAARRKAEAYCPGMNVNVWYDPQNPASATLTIPSQDWEYFAYVLLLLGAGFVIGGSIWLLRGVQTHGWTIFKW